MTADKDIICISSIDWDFVWQGHQEIMSTFAKNGNRVLYIENTGIRTPKFSDIGRLRHRIINWRKGIRGIRQESKNLFVCSPLIIPFPYSKIAKLINRFLLVNSIKVWMKAVGFKNPIIWTFLPTSITLDIIDKIDNSLVVYYCIAEFRELADSSKKVERAETLLLKRCDVVFAQGQKIKERCCRYNKNVYIFPFGVNKRFFHPCNGMRTVSIPSVCEQRRIGYIGGIHKHVNVELLKKIAAERPNWAIELVGPMQIDKDTFRGYKNIYLRGKKDHSELPFWISNFDACLIPYLLTEYTETVYPTKLNEYLAMGKPVISTPIPEVKRFDEENKDIIEIADDAESFCRKIDNILKKQDDSALKEKRKNIAMQSNWPSRIEKMSAIMESVMEDKEKEASRRWKDNFTRLVRITKKKIIAFTSVLVISYMLLFHTPLLWWTAKPLKVSSQLAKADVIVALGGGVGETGRAGQGYEERVKYAAELYKNGYAKKIIFSSGFVYALQEPDVMKVLAVSLGVSPDDIILEKKAGSTYENVKFSLAIADSKGYKRVIFVSSPYHMRRLKMTAEKIGGDKDYFVFSPIPYSFFYGNEKRVAFKHIKAILHEYLGILYYKIKGYA